MHGENSEKVLVQNQKRKTKLTKNDMQRWMRLIKVEFIEEPAIPQQIPMNHKCFFSLHLVFCSICEPYRGKSTGKSIIEYVAWEQHSLTLQLCQTWYDHLFLHVAKCRTSADPQLITVRIVHATRNVLANHARKPMTEGRTPAKHRGGIFRSERRKSRTTRKGKTSNFPNQSPSNLAGIPFRKITKDRKPAVIRTDGLA